jgi:hypothetical protein
MYQIYKHHLRKIHWKAEEAIKLWLRGKGIKTALQRLQQGIDALNYFRQTTYMANINAIIIIINDIVLILIHITFNNILY